MLAHLPRPDEYHLAVQHPNAAFLDADLKLSQIEKNPFGIPRVWSGGFALTYHAYSPRGSWAVRCYKRNISDLAARYTAISDYFRTYPSSYFTTVEHLEKGIRVKGESYPITKMGWIDAIPLNLYIEQHISQPHVLATLPNKFRSLVHYLSLRSIAHGDLQHGNILVSKAGELKLVDYDGMYVPTLAGRKSNELGHVDYQHPSRSADDFSPNLDRFAAIVIYLALCAVVRKPNLWTRYSTGENMLFRQIDFIKPAESGLLRELSVLEGLQDAVRHFRAICAGSIADVPRLEGLGSESLEHVQSQARPISVRRQYPVLRATEVDTLLRNSGERAEIIGRITNVSSRRLTRNGKPYVFVDFGDWRQGCFGLVLWSDALSLFEQAKVDIGQFEGRWVSITGIIDVYDQRPRLEILMPSEIVTLKGEQDAEERLAASQAKTNRAAVPTTQQERERRLTEIYSKIPPSLANRLRNLFN